MAYEKRKLDRTMPLMYGSRESGSYMPKDKLNESPLAAGFAKALIENQLLNEGNARLNPATFCQTYMDKEAVDLMAMTLEKNAIDKSEYPQSIVCRVDLTYNLAESFVENFNKCIEELKNAHVLCNEEKSGAYGFTH